MIIRKPGQPARRGGRHSRARGVARDKARETALARYVRLECGHLTTRETIEAYAVFQPGRGRYWCENCHFWRAPLPVIAEPDLDGNPPF